MKRYNLSSICKAANTLIKKGYNKSAAFRKAWELAKNVISKVAGVSFGKRPEALKRLTHYSPEMISVRLEREANNYDNSAIAVIATVEGKGAYCVGYMPSDTAKTISAIVDKGVEVTAKFDRIVGGWYEGMNYGIRIALTI